MANKSTSKGSRPSNFCIFTLKLNKVDINPTAAGKLMVNARAFLSQGKDEASGNYKPSIWFKLLYAAETAEGDEMTNFFAQVDKGDLVDVKGRLAYEEWQDSSGNKRSDLVLWVNEVSMHKAEDRKANYVILTMMVNSSELRYTGAGKPMVNARSYLPQGKDRSTDTYKPSFWVNLKHVAEGEDMDAICELFGSVEKGNRVTLKGRLALEQWEDREGNKRDDMQIWMREAQMFKGSAEAEAEAEEFEPEPEPEPEPA